MRGLREGDLEFSLPTTLGGDLLLQKHTFLHPRSHLTTMVAHCHELNCVPKEDVLKS